jgi:NitT/TauT family transport system substrate-binding protein
MNPEYADKKEVLVKQIEADIKGTFFSADTKAHGLGWMTKEAWGSTTKILLDQDVMKQSIDVSAVFSDKFLEGANALKR